MTIGIPKMGKVYEKTSPPLPSRDETYSPHKLNGNCAPKSCGKSMMIMIFGKKNMVQLGVLNSLNISLK